jgi:Predicted unusual protein kinase
MFSIFALIAASIKLIRSGLLDFVIAQTGAPKPILALHWLIRLLVAWRLAPKILTRDDIPKTIENLGPAYVKFGQFIATRPDIVASKWPMP